MLHGGWLAKRVGLLSKTCSVAGGQGNCVYKVNDYNEDD